MKLGITLAGLLALIVIPSGAHAGAMAYHVTDLGLLAGSTYNEARGINVSGQVIGASYFTPVLTHATLWNGTTATDLGTLGGTSSLAWAVNASGQVVGEHSFADSTTRAVLWNGTTATDLGTLGGRDSYAKGINASGQVVGSSNIANGPLHAVRWNGTTPTDLGTLGGSSSLGAGINASGQVVGRADLTGDSAYHATLWNGTTATDLGTLGGTHSLAFAINDSGQAVGWSFAAGSNLQHAALWNGTTVIDLGALGDFTSALGINASGQIVGSFSKGFTSHAFLYTDGTMYDLLSLLEPGSGVTDLYMSGYGAINDLGQIAVNGTIGGRGHALRLDPVAVPEPSSTLLLLGSGWMWMFPRHRGLRR